MIDAEGYYAFSVRQLAQRLAVTPSTVIHHVGQRVEILAAVVDAIVRESWASDLSTAEPPPSNWPDCVRRTADSYREVLTRHPNAAPLIIDVNCHSSAQGEASMPLLLELHAGGIPIDHLVETHLAIVGFVTGFALQLADDGLPRNHRVLAEQLTSTSKASRAMAVDAGFARGIEALIAGLAASIP